MSAVATLRHVRFWNRISDTPDPVRKRRESGLVHVPVGPPCQTVMLWRAYEREMSRGAYPAPELVRDNDSNLDLFQSWVIEGSKMNGAGDPSGSDF